MYPIVRAVPIALIVSTIAACHRVATTPSPVGGPSTHAVIPNPASISITPGADSFLVTARTVVYVDASATAEVDAVGTYAADLIASRFGVTSQRLAAGASLPDSSIGLSINSARDELGPEGYELTVTKTHVRIVAPHPAGLFYGVQTMRQLMPAAVEHKSGYQRRLTIPAARVTDMPRFAWRGAMLDVSRHFLPAEDVKRFIDNYALYKINRLHLHLSDDQGWRIEIKAWPQLTAVGGKTAIGGAPAGFYTQEQYADLVAYARSRYMTVVPEIDMPGHITAALVAYPDLRCDRTAPEPFTIIGGPPNSLCVSRDSTYTFVHDVVSEISAAAPTPYFHIGGDEVARMSKEDYRRFIERVEEIVTSVGPRMIGWGEIATANISPRTIVQHWTRDSSYLHAERNGELILSPGPRAYLDMKYDSATVLGLRWAGIIDLRKAYEWDPAKLLPNVTVTSILGVEAPLWAETVITRQDYEFLAFPRVTAIAELGWSAADRLGWESYRQRIGRHGARMAALGINFARAPGVQWSW